MEVKWVTIMVVVVFGGLFAADAVQSYNRTQCVIAGIEHEMSTEDIDKICKGK
jgi:hypothetical protein